MFLLSLLIVVPSLAFGGWPILAKKLGLSEAWTNVTLMTVTLLGLIIYYTPALLREEAPSSDKIGKMALIGVLNFAGMATFGPLMRLYPQYIPIAQVGMPMVGFLGGIFILGVATDWRQILFAVITAVGIAGMSYYTPPLQN